MSTLAQIRAAIVARLSAVPGVGIVHDRERYAKAEKDFRALYVGADGLLAGGYVRRRATSETCEGLGRWVTDHLWEVVLFRGFDDAASSETAFDAVIEAIRDAFRADDDLSVTVGTCTTDERAGIQLDESQPVMFAGVLCHQARLSLVTRIYR